MDFIYGGYLKRYSELQTRIDTIFDKGTYNCVSSAVFYAVFALAAGLDVSGVQTKDHAFICLHIGGGESADDVDIETTNPYGFDPGSKTEFTNKFGETGYAYVSPKNYRDRNPISLLELTSLIFTNRIATLTRQRKYADAVTLAVNNAALLKDRAEPSNHVFYEPPEALLDDTLLNYGGSLLQAGKEKEALDWGQRAVAAYPSKNSKWDEFFLAGVNNYMSRLFKAGDLEGGAAALEEYKPLLSAAGYARLSKLVDQARQVEAHNRIVSLHNQFAKLFNAKKYTEAYEFIQKALAENPGDKMLITDLQTVEKVL
jgi:tetratricopeptide (TPR) repeat protein